MCKMRFMNLPIFSGKTRIWTVNFTHTRSAVGGVCLCVSLILSGCATYSKTDSTLGAVFWYEQIWGKKCRVDGHEHTWMWTSSKAWNIWKTEAIQIAVQNWNWFTQGEYGANWSWDSANNKKNQCTFSSWVWTCNISANPCRIGN